MRGERVILDVDLARLYAVISAHRNGKPGRGGRRSLANAFTEHGAIMAANVLNSERAIQMSVVVVRAFVALRRFTLSSTDLARRLDELEARYDRQFGVVFEAVRRLMAPIDAPKASRLPLLRVSAFEPPRPSRTQWALRP